MINWFKTNKDHFTINMNGFAKPPILSYLSLLPLIDKSGSILDIGSGNCMLLKFIMEFSEHNIIPYGIDTNPEAIKYAVEEVLPEFSDNFLIDSIDSFHSEKFKFDIIIIIT